MMGKIMHNWRLLIASVMIIYFLAPSLDSREGLAISAAFALVLIASSRVALDRDHLRRYAAYFAITLVTYYILFRDQPWDFFLRGGAYESSAIPLIVCSAIMSLAGGLLLNDKSSRKKYAFITLGIQIPIALIVGTEAVQEAFTQLADRLGYAHEYAGSWEAWQLEWMLTYYLPMYFLSRPQK